MPDVVVLGGGLAGLLVARRLRALGADVVVVEARSEPPRKVGESTVEIGTHHLLGVQGLGEALSRHGWAKRGMHLFFGDGPLPRRSELAPPPGGAPRGVQLDRAGLERELLAAEPSVVIGVAEGVELGPPHRVRVARGGHHEVLVAPWVVDATGRRRLLARQEGWRLPVAHDTRARWLWLEGLDRHRALDAFPAIAGNPTLHLAEPGAWTWVIPQGATRAAIGSVGLGREVDPLARLESAGLTPWLAEGRLVGQGRGVGLATSSARILDPRGVALIGDAAGFTDPLFSPGLDDIAFGVDAIARAWREPAEVGPLDALLRNRLEVGHALVHAHYAALGSFHAFRVHYVGLLAQYFRQLARVLAGDHLDAPLVPVRSIHALARRIAAIPATPLSERIHDDSLDVPALRRRAATLDPRTLHRRQLRLVADLDPALRMSELLERLVGDPAPRLRRGLT